jgi:hypothetical protein
LQQDGTQPPAGPFLHPEGLFQLPAVDLAFLAQQFADLDLAGPGLVLDGSLQTRLEGALGGKISDHDGDSLVAG